MNLNTTLWFQFFRVCRSDDDLIAQNCSSNVSGVRIILLRNVLVFLFLIFPSPHASSSTSSSTIHIDKDSQSQNAISYPNPTRGLHHTSSSPPPVPKQADHLSLGVAYEIALHLQTCLSVNLNPQHSYSAGYVVRRLAFLHTACKLSCMRRTLKDEIPCLDPNPSERKMETLLSPNTFCFPTAEQPMEWFPVCTLKVIYTSWLLLTNTISRNGHSTRHHRGKSRDNANLSFLNRA